MEFTRKARILYAEQDEYAFSVVSSLLEFADIELVSAKTLSQAIQMAQAEEFDMFLLDVYFEDDDSLELCSRLRRYFPKSPILYYSGSPYEGDKQSALDAGANAYFKKPFFNELFDSIIKILGYSEKLVVFGNESDSASLPLSNRFGV